MLLIFEVHSSIDSLQHTSNILFTKMVSSISMLLSFEVHSKNIHLKCKKEKYPKLNKINIS